MSKIFLIESIALFSCGQVNEKITVPSQEVEKDNIDSLAYLNQVNIFIREVMEKELNDTAFILVDKPFAFEYFECIQELLTDTANYSKEERLFIQEATRKSKIKFWSSPMFSKVKMMDSKTIDSVFNDRSKGWKYFHENIGQSFNSFSAPIFFRNYSYCIFYFDNSCDNLCGGGQLILYKKQNGKWKNIQSYCNWVS
jgi:hypothetical protein